MAIYCREFSPLGLGDSRPPDIVGQSSVYDSQRDQDKLVLSQGSGGDIRKKTIAY